MKVLKRTLALLFVLALTLPTVALAVEDGYSSAYTYTYDYWGDAQESPDAYRVETVIDSITLGMDTLDGVRIKQPQSLFVHKQDVYVVDTGNNRILQLNWDGENFSTVRVIKEIKGCDVTTFNVPGDVFVDDEENIYVADTNNERVVMVDKDLNFIKEFIKPTDATFDQGLSFLPKRLVVDVAGRVYCLVSNVNKGLVKYEADGTFTGFIGANAVSVNMGEYIWRRFFMTKEQRAQTANFVPTEYENCYIDPDGFIYVTNTVFSEYDLMSDAAKPIRRLNNLGSDILVKNDRYPPIGDLNWVEQSQTYGPSKFADITVLEDEIYVAVDRTRGRLFGYDNQGVLLWAFGTKGNTDGAFGRAVSVEHIGRRLLVLDQLENSITVFIPTEYGNTIYQANDAYTRGEYDESAELWREVMKMNANYPLAFRGIGRAVLRQDQFEEAMEYFKLAHDRPNYGRAFKLYRKEWVEKNVWIIVLVLAVLLIIPLVLGRLKKMKWEVEIHERSKVRK